MVLSLLRVSSFLAYLQIRDVGPIAEVDEPTLPGIAYERYINGFVERVREELDPHGLRRDMAVFLSLLGADKVILQALPTSDLAPGTIGLTAIHCSCLTF
ncbi:hypothetical protein [Hydrogenophaga sp.]|uniref:hypothetical protein n=1 Tax=Hydrogenophaga sp. TaxID=1904254 RepID=UPI002727BE0C|nr:hypothetical protein [Hydrogenophaga sp.]MDO9437729.1 hypothetical protein [Hydrogenophaga sp.]